jgi:large subunit ribosomal protein L27
MAHKKSSSSSRNGRDTSGKRLGVKAPAGCIVSAGTILVRQHGTNIHAGVNVGLASDYSLFAKTDGRVAYTVYRGRKTASVQPE